ncbi:MAG TPA: fructose-bisphosphate aldolase class I [Dehalococcoidia bacterium]|jgi:fructose-bisphosphate aldolase class I|nr:class I fructose-bisphosphate aldolase [Chloroflexota bacterium]HIM59856.1 fructose-bisphosphate aldolase class I [Dehalococcoidia bacterium]HIN16154.1 fructose-bisphosphate aldolase class I [Dehalococcoidia bacterium]
MASAELNSIARAMVARKKGILAADESTGTMTSRLDSIGVESTVETRRQWRQLLFTTPDIGDYISGVIMYDETIRQSDDSGVGLVDVLAASNVLTGIKVDNSTHDLAGAPGENITEGLDGLRPRLAEYFLMGARFAKWRALIKIGEGRPSDYAIRTNMHALGRYAALCQEQGLVPIVEPEVLMDGTHSIDDCRSATDRSLSAVFEELDAQNVDLAGIVLKPNMVLSGSGASDRAPAEEVARQTVDCFLEHVPASVPGIAFLSGGQGNEESVVNLDAINKIANREDLPWELTYSYGRGLQAAPLAAWKGEVANVAAAQAVFQQRGRDSSVAREGVYS